MKERVRCSVPHPAQGGSASVNTGPLCRLIKAEIISSYLEKEFFLLGLPPRTCQRSGRKEISVSLGRTRVRGRRETCSLCVRRCSVGREQKGPEWHSGTCTSLKGENAREPARKANSYPYREGRLHGGGDFRAGH